MQRAIAILIYLPALIGWVVFAPAYRVANWLSQKVGIHQLRYSQWFWCGVEAKDHKTFYEIYDEE